MDRNRRFSAIRNKVVCFVRCLKVQTLQNHPSLRKSRQEHTLYEMQHYQYQLAFFPQEINFQLYTKYLCQSPAKSISISRPLIPRLYCTYWSTHWYIKRLSAIRPSIISCKFPNYRFLFVIIFLPINHIVLKAISYCNIDFSLIIVPSAELKPTFLLIFENKSTLPDATALWFVLAISGQWKQCEKQHIANMK